MCSDPPQAFRCWLKLSRFFLQMLALFCFSAKLPPLSLLGLWALIPYVYLLRLDFVIIIIIIIIIIVAAILLLLFMVLISLVPALNLLYFYISTFRSMCAVPNMAVFFSSLNSCFPGTLLTYFLNYFEIVPVAPIITDITFIINIIIIVINWSIFSCFFGIDCVVFLISFNWCLLISVLPLITIRVLSQHVKIQDCC